MFITSWVDVAMQKSNHLILQWADCVFSCRDWAGSEGWAKKRVWDIPGSVHCQECEGERDSGWYSSTWTTPTIPLLF